MRQNQPSPMSAVIDAIEQRQRPSAGSGSDAVIASQLWYHGTDASFEQFRRHGIGIHFGSLAQARNAPRGRSRIIEARLDVHNPLSMPDLYSWESYDIAERLQNWFEVDLKDLILAIVTSRDGDDPAFFQRLIQTMESLGYDGIRYPNTMEGAGESAIAFHPGQIEIVRTGAVEEFAQHS